MLVRGLDSAAAAAAGAVAAAVLAALAVAAGLRGIGHGSPPGYRSMCRLARSIPAPAGRSKPGASASRRGV